MPFITKIVKKSPEWIDFEGTSFNEGIKTATSAPSTVGVATGRKYLRLTNESLITRCRAGDSGISDTAGVIIEPLQSVHFKLTPANNTDIYVLAEGAACKLAYYEVIA